MGLSILRSQRIHQERGYGTFWTGPSTSRPAYHSHKRQTYGNLWCSQPPISLGLSQLGQCWLALGCVQNHQAVLCTVRWLADTSSARVTINAANVKPWLRILCATDRPIQYSCDLLRPAVQRTASPALHVIRIAGYLRAVPTLHRRSIALVADNKTVRTSDLAHLCAICRSTLGGQR